MWNMFTAYFFYHEQILIYCSPCCKKSYIHLVPHAYYELQTSWQVPADEGEGKWSQLIFSCRKHEQWRWLTVATEMKSEGGIWCSTAVRKMEVRRKYSTTQLIHEKVETACYSVAYLQKAVPVLLYIHRRLSTSCRNMTQMSENTH